MIGHVSLDHQGQIVLQQNLVVLIEPRYRVIAEKIEFCAWLVKSQTQPKKARHQNCFESQVARSLIVPSKHCFKEQTCLTHSVQKTIGRRLNAPIRGCN